MKETQYWIILIVTILLLVLFLQWLDYAHNGPFIDIFHERPSSNWGNY